MKKKSTNTFKNNTEYLKHTYASQISKSGLIDSEQWKCIIRFIDNNIKSIIYNIILPIGIAILLED